MANPNGMKRLFAWVKADTHLRVKIAAAKQGITMDEWVQSAADAKLKREKNEEHK